MTERRRRRARLGIEALVVLLVALVVPRAWLGRGAEAAWTQPALAQAPLARRVAAHAQGALDPARYQTGSAHFNGEWALVTCQMTVLGLGQLALADEAARDAYLPAIDACVDWMVSPEALAFGAARWPKARGEVWDRGDAYMGYVNMALGIHRLLRPDSKHRVLHDRLTQAFVRRMREGAFFALETYPGEVFPADMATVAGSVALHGRATGASYAAVLEPWGAQWRRLAVDPKTGLVFQRLDPGTGAPVDLPRASGTAFSVYFLGWSHPKLSADLWRALAAQCAGRLDGFGAMREYPPGVQGGWGDIDSGPVLFGVGPSASAFAMAGARLHGDREIFDGLWRTSQLVGVPVRAGDQRGYVLGGPLGDALLLAMSTAGLGRPR